MSHGNLKSLDKLRKLKGRVVDYRCGVVFDRAVDDLEAEIAERYMELPVDADGVPIRVGDVIQFVNDAGGTGAGVEVCAVSNYYAYYGEGKHFYRARNCRHVKPRTIEDVLGDAVGELFNADISTGSTEWDEVIAKYAAEIRELMGVGE